MSMSKRIHSRGVSLIFALLTLMALSLAALALVRSVDTGALVLGNLGFKQDATATGDQATRQAIAWINSAASLTDDVGASGYYAGSHDALDVTGQQMTNANRALVNWDMNNCAYAKSGTYGDCTVRPSDEIKINDSTTARYVIFRLCPSAGVVDSSNACSVPTGVVAGTLGGGSGEDYNHLPLPTLGTGVYYRIIVRVVGARNTVSFVETIVSR